PSRSTWCRATGCGEGLSRLESCVSWFLIANRVLLNRCSSGGSPQRTAFAYSTLAGVTCQISAGAQHRIEYTARLNERLLRARVAWLESARGSSASWQVRSGPPCQRVVGDTLRCSRASLPTSGRSPRRRSAAERDRPWPGAALR